MVRDTTPFALLIEAGFVTNRQDMSTDPRVAAAGIAKYYENSGF
jgi:N-acetylmuramoyl-L-alanine amidase